MAVSFRHPKRARLLSQDHHRVAVNRTPRRAPFCSSLEKGVAFISAALLGSGVSGLKQSQRRGRNAASARLYKTKTMSLSEAEGKGAFRRGASSSASLAAGGH